MFVAIALCSACFHSVPQKTVKTSTAVSSGPPRYVSWGVAAAAIRWASGRWSGTTRIGCCSAAADFLERGLVAMRRSLRDEMNSHYAGWGDQQAGTLTVPKSSKNVNGTSHQAHASGRDLFRERVWYCADKDARRLHERADKS